jgi:hypothetical protein
LVSHCKHLLTLKADIDPMPGTARGPALFLKAIVQGGLMRSDLQTNGIDRLAAIEHAVDSIWTQMRERGRLHVRGSIRLDVAHRVAEIAANDIHDEKFIKDFLSKGLIDFTA